MSSTERAWLWIAAAGLAILAAIWGWDFIVLGHQLKLPTVTEYLRGRRWLDPAAIALCFVPGGLLLGHLYGQEMNRLGADFLLGGALALAACLVGALYLSS